MTRTALTYFLDGNQLKVALLKRGGKGVEILFLRTFSPNAASENVKQLYTEEDSELFSVCALDSSDTLLRHLSLPLTNPLKIRAALPFQLEALLPYPPEEAIVIPFTQKKEKRQTSITFFATRLDQVNAQLVRLKTHALEPDILSCVPAALYAWAQFVFPETPSFVLFDVGMEKSSMICIVNKKLQISQPLSMGVGKLFEALAQDFPGKSEEELGELAKSIDLSNVSHLPNIAAQTVLLQRELERIIQYLKQKKILSEGFPFALAGELFSPFRLQSFLNALLSESLTPLTPKQHPLFAHSSLQAYAIPLGLGLDALGDLPVQLLQGQMAPLPYCKKRAKSVIVYVCLCLCLAVQTGLFGSFWLNKKENRLQEQFLSDRGPFSGKMSDELALWEEELSGQRSPFPFDPSVPKVSDLLAYLSTKEGIEITKAHYRLTKHPTIARPHDPYTVKVELEFTATSPEMAHHFHEALLQDTSLIRSQAEITWRVKEPFYHTSFYLETVNSLLRTSR
jgi:type IV pilus assembly protein PilM